MCGYVGKRVARKTIGRDRKVGRDRENARNKRNKVTEHEERERRREAAERPRERERLRWDNLKRALTRARAESPVVASAAEANRASIGLDGVLIAH